MNTVVSQENFRALVVDDEPVVRRMVSFALQQEGFECDTAVDGEQALDRMRQRHYDLLVTDLRMPRKHGHALAVQVLAGKSRPRIMVHTSVDDARLTKDLVIRGVDDIVYKPTNYAAFAAKARGLIVRDRRSQSAQQPVESAADASNRKDGKQPNDRSPLTLSEMRDQLSDVSMVLPVSHAALDACNMVRSGTFDAAQVTTVVQRDPALTEKVLRLANSPFYNSTGTEITDTRDAVTRIGQKRIGEFALALSAFSSIRDESLPWFDLDLAWRRGVAAGIAVELLIAEGQHESISDGLLFSALMHWSGRTVLGVHYPERYDAIVKTCTDKKEPLLKHEQLVFPEDHAKVMCGLLADWRISAEFYAPLEHTLTDYASVSTLLEPTRTKVELVKLAIFIGEIAVGIWEPWDAIVLPPSSLLDRLRIDSICTIVERTKAELPGIADVRIGTELEAPNSPRQPSASRQLDYIDLSNEQSDFLAMILQAMGITLRPTKLEPGRIHESVLVNRIGAAPSPEIARMFSSTKCERIVFVRDANKMTNVGRLGVNLAVPCSYAALRSVCCETGPE